MPIYGITLVVHKPWIPFAEIFGNGKQTPMYENTEFGFFVPFGHSVFGKTAPIRLILSVFIDFIYLFYVAEANFLFHNYSALTLEHLTVFKCLLLQYLFELTTRLSVDLAVIQKPL